jgi:hypothetical protein
MRSFALIQAVGTPTSTAAALHDAAIERDAEPVPPSTSRSLTELSVELLA